MHGGLFNSDDVSLDDIRKINRNRQPPDEGETLYSHCVLCDIGTVGLMCELLWSDPQVLVS